MTKYVAKNEELIVRIDIKGQTNKLELTFKVKYVSFNL